MDPTRFVAPHWGSAIDVGGIASYVTFVPASLPVELVLPPGTIMLLSEADAALGRSAPAGQRLHHPRGGVQLEH